MCIRGVDIQLVVTGPCSNAPAPALTTPSHGAVMVSVDVPRRVE